MMLASLALLAPCRAAAQEVSAVVEQALDQQVDHLEISNTPLPAALAMLEDRTGLRFAIDPGVLARMPYGDRTEVSITLKNISVRRAMARVCAGLGLTMRVSGDRVRLEASPVLRRVARRLTVEETGLLAQLADRPWRSLTPAPPVRFDLPPEARVRELFDQAMQQAGGESAISELEAATRAAGWVWYPDGGVIVITAPRALIDQRLDQPLDVTYQRIALDEMLVDLGERIGVGVRFEPGALQAVAARDRLVDLIRRQTTVRQILERICGNTGLRYEVRDDGLLISASSAGAAVAGPPRRIVAHLSVPLKDGALLNVPVYEDELASGELQRVREDALRLMRESLRGGRP